MIYVVYKSAWVRSWIAYVLVGEVVNIQDKCKEVNIQFKSDSDIKGEVKVSYTYIWSFQL